MVRDGFLRATEEAPDLGKYLRSEVLPDAGIVPWVGSPIKEPPPPCTSMGSSRQGRGLSPPPVRAVGRVCSRTQLPPTPQSLESIAWKS